MYTDGTTWEKSWIISSNGSSANWSVAMQVTIIWSGYLLPDFGLDRPLIYMLHVVQWILVDCSLFSFLCLQLDSRAVSAGFLHRSSIAEGRNVCCCQVAAFCCVCSRASRRVSISQKGIVKCDVFGPIYISYVRCRDEHQAVGIVKHYELNLSLF